MIGFSAQRRRWSSFSVLCNIVFDALAARPTRMPSRIMRDLRLCTLWFLKQFLVQLLASNWIAYKSGAKMNELSLSFSLVNYWKYSVYIHIITGNDYLSFCCVLCMVKGVVDLCEPHLKIR